MSLAETHQRESADKDLPLREDIRLLGAILGDTVQAQEGETVLGLSKGKRAGARLHSVDATDPGHSTRSRYSDRGTTRGSRPKAV